MLNKITAQQATFSDKQICHELGKYVVDKENLFIKNWQKEPREEQDDKEFLTPEIVNKIFKNSSSRVGFYRKRTCQRAYRIYR